MSEVDPVPVGAEASNVKVGDKEKFTCSLCGDCFDCKKEYNRHVRDHKSIYKCDVCDKAFIRKQNMMKHRYDDHRNIFLKCTTCDIMFKKIGDMNLHQKFHSKECPYLCMLCLKSFKNLNNLREHYKHHEKEITEAISSKKIFDSDVSDLDDNHEAGNGLEVGTIIPNKKPFTDGHICTVCGRTFLLRHNLVTHSYSHESKGSFQCDYCEQVFDMKHKLLKHVKSHEDKNAHRRKVRKARLESNPNELLCHFCGKSFRDDRNLRRHKEFHLPKGHYPCKMCDKVFDLNVKLKMHMMRHRKKKNPPKLVKPGVFPCSYCGKVFPYSNSLNVHQQLHTKYLTCPLCGKVFNKKWNLKTHMSIHLEFKPYSCSYCGASYADRSNLKKHLMKHPPELGATIICTKTEIGDIDGSGDQLVIN